MLKGSHKSLKNTSLMWEFAILEHRRCFNLLPHSRAFSIQSPRRTAKSVKMFFGSQIKLCTQSKLAIVILYVLIIYHHSSPVLTSCCGRVAANPQTQSKDSKWPSFANHLQDKFIDFGQLEFFDKAKQFAERQQKRNNMKQICQAYCMLNPLKRRPFEQLKWHMAKRQKNVQDLVSYVKHCILKDSIRF